VHERQSAVPRARPEVVELAIGRSVDHTDAARSPEQHHKDKHVWFCEIDAVRAQGQDLLQEYSISTDT
jgi:hypothetical protein